jgi:arylsulfatase A-like enzyme
MRATDPSRFARFRRRWWANLFAALSALVFLKLLMIADQVVGTEAYASPWNLLAKLPLLLGWDVVGAAGVAALAAAAPFRAWAVVWQLGHALLGGVSFQLTRIIGGPLTKAGIDLATMQESGGEGGPALASSVGHYWTLERWWMIFGGMFLAVGVLVWRTARPMSRRGSRIWGGALGALAFVTVFVLPWMVNGELGGLRVHTYGLERSPGAALVGSYLAPLISDGIGDRPGDPWEIDLAAKTPDQPVDNPLRGARPKATGVILVSMESVAATYLRDPEVMPFVATVGDEVGGVRLEAHYSVWPQTMKSFFSLFCGELPYPRYQTIPMVNPAIPCVSVSEALKAGGWRTALITSADLGYDRKMRFFRHRGFDHVVDMHSIPDQEGAWKDSWGVEEAVAVRHAVEWAAGDPSKPWFIFYEMITAHHPYTPTKEMAASPMPNDQAGYMRALRYIDDQMRALVQGLGPDALVVILADHGEGFGQHPGSQSHGSKVWQEAIHVPMVILGPQLREAGVSGRVTLNTSHIDVAPTILGLLGQPVPCTMRGRDLTRTSAPRVALFGGRPPGAQMGLADGRWKYIRDSQGADRLFDLRHDYDERHDLAGEQPELVAGFRARIEDWEAFGSRLIPDYAALLKASRCGPSDER